MRHLHDIRGGETDIRMDGQTDGQTLWRDVMTHLKKKSGANSMVKPHCQLALSDQVIDLATKYAQS